MDNVICETKIKVKVSGGYIFLMIFLFLVAIPVSIMSYNPYWISETVMSILACFAPSIIMLIILICNIAMSKKCFLKLYNDKVDGQRTGFSVKTLKLPIDKVDSIMVSQGFGDKIMGGKTVAIRSASGLIKFPWVQNADEFVEATLAKIEEHKQKAQKDNRNLVAEAFKNVNTATAVQTAAPSAATKIKELKELLDSGIISQEDFEAKKQELLSKM